MDYYCGAYSGYNLDENNDDYDGEIDDNESNSARNNSNETDEGALIAFMVIFLISTLVFAGIAWWYRNKYKRFKVLFILTF